MPRFVRDFGSILLASTSWLGTAAAQPAPASPVPPTAAAEPSAPPPAGTAAEGAQPPTAPPAPESAPALDARSAESAPAAPAPSAVAPTVPAEPVPEADEPPAPKALAVADDGTLAFGALLQFWLFRSQRDEAVTSTFRVRRAELKVFGEILPDDLAYKLVVDPAKVLETRATEVPVEGQEPEPTNAGTVTVAQPADKLSLFQDFAITFLWDYADLSVGQFKNGLSYEGHNSSSRLLFPERSPVAREYGDQRDIGISVSKEFEHFHYFAGVFNGTGLNLRDTNNQKDLSVRLELLPLDGLLFGLVGYTPLGERSLATTKDRVEADVRLELADFLVQAEYLRGWDGASDDRVTGHGFYGALGYTLFDKLQPVVRVGQLDTDLDANGAGGDDELTHYDVGLNYYILGQKARLSASASIFDFEDEPTQTDIILMAQASF